MTKIYRRFEVTNEDTTKVRKLMKANGIKGTVRKGKGSCRFWLEVKTKDRRIIDLVKHLGFRLLFEPKDWWERYTFEKGHIEIIKAETGQ